MAIDVGTFPKMVVRPMISTSGLWNAARIAMLSSGDGEEGRAELARSARALEDLPNSIISRTDTRIRVYDELQRSHGGRIAGSTTHTERAVPDHFVLGEVTVSTTIVNR